MAEQHSEVGFTRLASFTCEPVTTNVPIVLAWAWWMEKPEENVTKTECDKCRKTGITSGPHLIPYLLKTLLSEKQPRRVTKAQAFAEDKAGFKL